MASSDNSSDNKVEEDEEPDEWTALADTYTSVLVPAFAPIYQAIVDDVLVGGVVPRRVLDFGCGPGEQILCLCEKYTDTIISAVGVDSTPAMLEIAKERSKEKKNIKNIDFVHVRRDCTMADFKDAVGGGPFDMVISAFVFNYLGFDRRVDVMKTLLVLSPTVLLVTWGNPSNVSFLRAIKTFVKWNATGGDICATSITEDPKMATGSFVMSQKEPFQSIVDKVGMECTMTFETRQFPLVFSNASALLRFLPIPTNDDDCSEMSKLLNHWKETDSTISIDEKSGELRFETDIVFSSFKRSDSS